jgi:hypothetical protein
MEFVTTVLFMTSQLIGNHESINAIANIGNRRDVRSSDIINYLKEKGVKIMRINVPYENIMISKIASNPIVIKYSVLRHEYEDPRLPTVWIQFCLFLKKENLLIPVNATGQNIKLGTQFNSCTWKNSFEDYTRKNLNKRIAPVDRIDRKNLRSLVRNLEFNNTILLWQLIG